MQSASRNSVLTNYARSTRCESPLLRPKIEYTATNCVRCNPAGGRPIGSCAPKLSLTSKDYEQPQALRLGICCAGCCRSLNRQRRPLTPPPVPPVRQPPVVPDRQQVPRRRPMVRVHIPAGCSGRAATAHRRGLALRVSGPSPLQPFCTRAGNRVATGAGHRCGQMKRSRSGPGSSQGPP